MTTTGREITRGVYRIYDYLYWRKDRAKNKGNFSRHNEAFSKKKKIRFSFSNAVIKCYAEDQRRFHELAGSRRNANIFILIKDRIVAPFLNGQIFALRAILIRHNDRTNRAFVLVVNFEYIPGILSIIFKAASDQISEYFNAR